MAADVTPGMANGPCVEQPITPWRKSSRSSDPEFAQCVEVAPVARGVSWVLA